MIKKTYEENLSLYVLYEVVFNSKLVGAVVSLTQYFPVGIFDLLPVPLVLVVIVPYTVPVQVALIIKNYM